MNNDINKAEKLAAARKKLKEFQNQQKNKENNDSVVSHFQKSATELFSEKSTTKAIEQNESLVHTTFNDEMKFENSYTNSSVEHQSQLADYFSNSGKNNPFFETIPKVDGFDVTVDKFSESNVPVNSNLPQSLFSSHSNASYSSPPFPASTLFSDTENLQIGKESEQNDDIENLKNKLTAAESKIKMQAEALDIITSEREHLQTKLNNALQESNVYKEKISTLEAVLEENKKYQMEQNATNTELKQFKDEVSGREFALQQNINDLKEKNDELKHSLDLQNERNNLIQNQLNEVQSYRDMLSLKFQQLGIEIDGESDNKSYRAICEESDSLKRKCSELEEQIKTLMFEREHTDSEYRQYVQSLQEELHQTNCEFQKLSSENQTLVDKISSQTEHISALEKQLQHFLASDTNETLTNSLENEIQTLKQEIQNEKERSEQILQQWTESLQWKERVSELESELETVKAEVMNTSELQMAVESNKVAASQAIAQNNKLKVELERLNNIIKNLDNEKDILNHALEEEKAKNKELTQLQEESIIKQVNNVALRSDASSNTESDSFKKEENGYGETSLVAMQQLQEKFKSVVDRMADLTDEKQQLEHLVMQLQSETETIEEYVALYQKQRSILQQKARETDFKMERVSKEKERLLNIIRSILTTGEFDCSLVKRLVQQNLSAELNDELNRFNGFETDGPSENLFPYNKESVEHHPTCHCCSGKLITI